MQFQFFKKYLHGTDIIEKKKHSEWSASFFHGVDNGIRTHDLQSHNLTR